MFASLHTASYATRRVQWAGSTLHPLARIRAALDLRVQRCRLARLDDRLLADIGVSRAEAASEGNRSMWDRSGVQ